MTIPWLTHAALLHAWEHVRENHGCAGADGVTIERFATRLDSELDDLRSRVEAGEYRPFPLLPIVVEKKPHSSATRTLLVPTVRDRVLQTAAGRHLGQAFEDEFLDCSFAYRPHRSVNSAIARIRFLHDHVSASSPAPTSTRFSTTSITSCCASASRRASPSRHCATSF